MKKLLDKGISTRRGIMTAHQESAYKKTELSLPISEKLRDNSVIIPLYPGMSNSEITFCIKKIKDAVDN